MPGRRLDSWKEIAAYLGRTVRTVQRWEREQRLPVHRLHHNKLPTVYAFTRDLDEWWHQRRGALEAAESSHPDPSPTSPDVELTTSEDGMPSGAVADKVAAPAVWQTTQPARGLAGWRVVALVSASLAVGAGLGWGIPRLVESTQDARGQRAAALVSEGRQFWNQRTPTGFRQALTSFQQAVKQDPSNALAYSGLADTYLLMQGFGVMSRDDALALARAAASKAIELGPSVAAAHTSSSMVLWELGQQAAAFTEVERAIALDPNYATARHWYALYLDSSGRTTEALVQARSAQALDPMSPIIACDLAVLLRNAGQMDAARALLERTHAAHPTFPQIDIELQALYFQAGRFDLALAHLRRAVENGDDRPLMLARLAWLEARTGDATAAHRSAERVMTAQAGENPSPQAVSIAMIAEGDLDAAYAVVAKALEEEQPWVVGVASDPLFENLRQSRHWGSLDSGMKSLAERLRIPAS
jgi:tetratricopeptide (TPR) repeat protein